MKPYNRLLMTTTGLIAPNKHQLNSWFYFNANGTREYISKHKSNLDFMLEPTGYQEPIKVTVE